jgi:hypothetical protein
MTRLSLKIPSYSNSISLDPNTRSIVTVSTFLLFVNLILKNELIRESFKNGLIISTATDLSIRDYKDLIFERSKKENIKLYINLQFLQNQKLKEQHIQFFYKHYELLLYSMMWDIYHFLTKLNMH